MSLEVTSHLPAAKTAPLTAAGKAARSHGLSTSLELSTFSSPHDPVSDKRPDLAITSWPSGSSLKATDLATTSPASSSLLYSLTPSSLDYQRLLKKREAQKVSEYRDLAQQKGGELKPLAVGTSGASTATAKKLLQVVCSSQGDPTSRVHRCSYEFWLAKISFSLHKSAASEATTCSAKVSGRQFPSPFAPSSYPDPADTHFEVSG